MTRFTISISEYDDKAKALMEYLKTLDFITIEETSVSEYELSEEELEALNRGLKDIDEGRVYSDEEVKKRIRNKIENAGKK
jgi:predicted transcriptional regulator